jgi:hypothetical protein
MSSSPPLGPDQQAALDALFQGTIYYRDIRLRNLRRLEAILPRMPLEPGHYVFLTVAYKVIRARGDGRSPLDDQVIVERVSCRDYPAGELWQRLATKTLDMIPVAAGNETDRYLYAWMMSIYRAYRRIAETMRVCWWPTVYQEGQKP